MKITGISFRPTDMNSGFRIPTLRKYHSIFLRIENLQHLSLVEDFQEKYSGAEIADMIR